MRKQRKKQKRNESKYILPDGISLIDNLGNPNYNKESVLLFEDDSYGEFKSSYKAIQGAKASTHPKAVASRREATNLLRYGSKSPAGNKSIMEKTKKTMLKKYGFENPMQNEKVKEKSRNTLFKNYGVSNTMHSVEIRNTVRETVVERYGVTNVMKVPEVVDRLKKSNMNKYGFDNPSKHPEIIGKILDQKLINQKNGESKGELQLKKYIESFGFSTKKTRTGGSRPTEIDIEVLDYNLCFEFHGAYWHCAYHKHINPTYHLNKMRSCKKRLIQVFDFEWKNKPSQLKSFIRSALGKNNRKIFARKCEIVNVDKKEANDFLNRYHILGKANHKYCYGLVYKGELLSLITLSMHHRTGDELILNRFVGKEDVSVVGGLSKLTKHASKAHGDVSTWIDLRFSDGKNWINNGWELVHTLHPDYFYFNTKTGKIATKQSRRKKKVNTPEWLTETEHAKQEGLYKVHDCGKLKLIYKKK